MNDINLKIVKEYVDKKVAGTLTGKSAYQVAVDNGFEGTEQEWLAEIKNYEELNNKPSINNVTLSGNKSSDDLSLQGKLTAGNNITINNGVISARGGVTSYKDLTDKPKISGANGSGYVPKWDLIKSLDFNTDGFLVSGYSDGSIRVSLSRYIFRTTYINEYDFNYLDQLQIGTFTGSISEDGRSLVTNFPEELDINREKDYYISHYGVSNSLYPFVRKISGISELGKYKEYAQFIALAWDSQANAYKVHEQTPWLDISNGGSQIVSGVVNANGTITFTDSEGNSFTTSGESIIGPQGAPGQDYILTAQDKTDIANIVLSELPTTQGVLYGNQSN